MAQVPYSEQTSDTQVKNGPNALQKQEWNQYFRTDQQALSSVLRAGF